ncbi:MAG: NAD(P)-dependent oxidoreductase [SAR202 cluster bacterium]|jgi:D-3-phosphoglycerate dehydrogenase|nr:NAD(P)-dependent oxidoreductase [SAR202 cluster bacterium]
MKVLVADRFSETAQAQIAETGINVINAPDLRDDALAQAVVDTEANILIVRSTRVEASTLNAGAETLRLIIRAGAGFNTIDVATATRLGIHVANCPGMNAHAVAEIAFGLILSLDRSIHDNVLDLRNGRYDKAGYSDAPGLYGKTLGIIGLGYTGRAMVPLAKAFGMDVVAWSRSLTPDRASELGVRRLETPLDVAANSNIVSLHVALNDDTRHMISEKFLDAMKPGAYLINTARSEVVDESALAEAVRSKGIKVGVDVFEGEPSTGTGVVDNPLFSLPGVIGAHHIGGATLQAHQAIADETVRIVLEFASSGMVLNAVG